MPESGGMISARLFVWGMVLIVALGALVLREVAPAQLIARGSDSERAGILLEQRFGERIHSSRGQRTPSAPGVVIAALTTGLLGLAVVGSRRSARERVAAACVTVVTALCAGGLTALLGLGSPAGVLATIAAGGGLLLGLRISEATGKPTLGPLVALPFYLGVAVADIPAVRTAAAAAAVGSVVGWAAAASLGPVVGRLDKGPPATARGGRELGGERGFGRLGWALALTTLVVLAVGAALRPPPLEASDVTAPFGFQIVIRDPEGFRGDGFMPVYRLAHALQRQEGVERVESIATLIPEATAEQAQNFFLSPLGADPSKGLIAGTDLTRFVFRMDLAPGSGAARALVEQARALSDGILPDSAAALVGGRAAALVDVRGALWTAHWGLALALMPAWLALRLLGRGPRAALVAVALAALAGAACLGLNALLPNTSPPSRLAPGIALTVAAAIAGAVAAATSPESKSDEEAKWAGRSPS